ncbi:MAG: carboxysome shell protein, partial [Synechococcus sp. MED-G135]
MARLSSRELALERRKALTTAGKKASVAATGSANRVRNASDARQTRTNANASEAPAPVSSPEPVAVAPRRPQGLTSAASSSSRSTLKVKRDPSRDLVLARREALSRRGKTADKSSDRNRADVARQTKAAPVAVDASKKDCGCGGSRSAAKGSPARPAVTVELSNRSGDRRASAERRTASPKRRAIENPSRALVLARREAMAKHG